MKKSIIALMGLFTLVACSEDVYQEAHKMNETGTVENGSGGMQTNSEDIGLPGSTIPGYTTPHYLSPYSAPGSSSLIEYHFVNNTPNTIVITPSVGFYCYGTAVDPYYASYLSNPVNYPNLFAGGNQYGNTVALDPIILPPGANLMHGPSTAGLPIGGATWGSGFSYSSSSITTQEVDAMMEIGKMHHLRYDVYEEGSDPKGGTPFVSGELKQQVGPDNMVVGMVPANWRFVANLSSNPNLAFMVNNSPSINGKNETCLFNQAVSTIVPSEIVITDPMANNYTLSYTTDINNVYVVFQ